MFLFFLPDLDLTLPPDQKKRKKEKKSLCKVSRYGNPKFGQKQSHFHKLFRLLSSYIRKVWFCMNITYYLYILLHISLPPYTATKDL